MPSTKSRSRSRSAEKVRSRSNSISAAPQTNGSASPDKATMTKSKTMGFNDKQEAPQADAPFDIRKVSCLFAACVSGHGEEDVCLQTYVHAWQALNSMFPLFGRLFTFVQSDVADKNRILQEYVQGQHKLHYKTVMSMCAREVEQKSTACLNPPSACRTLLRLHRALEFVIEFMREVIASKDTDHMSTVARSSYDSTLKMICQLTQSSEGADPVLANQAMSEMVKHASEVYERCQKIYASNKLLDLP